MSDGLSWISFLLSVLAILLSSGAIVLLYHRRGTTTSANNGTITSSDDNNLMNTNNNNRTSPSSDSLILSVPNNQSEHEYAPVLVTTTVSSSGGERSEEVLLDRNVHLQQQQQPPRLLYPNLRHHQIRSSSALQRSSIDTSIIPQQSTAVASSVPLNTLQSSSQLSQSEPFNITEQDVKNLVNKAIEEYKMAISEQIQQSLTSSTRQIQQNALNWMKNMEVRVLEQVDRRIEKVTEAITFSEPTPFDEEFVDKRDAIASRSNENKDDNALLPLVQDLQSQISTLKQNLLEMEHKFNDQSRMVESELQQLKKQNTMLVQSVADNREKLEEMKTTWSEHANYSVLQSQQDHLYQSLTVLELRMREQENYVMDQLAKQSMIATQTYSISVDSPSSSPTTTASTVSHLHEDIPSRVMDRTPSPSQMDLELNSETSSDVSSGDSDHGHHVGSSPMSQLLNEGYFHEDDEEDQQAQQ